MIAVIKGLAWMVTFLVFALSSQLLLRFRTDSIWPHVPKTAAESLSAYLAGAGLLGAVLAVAMMVTQGAAFSADGGSLLSIVFSMPVALIMGLAGALISGAYLYRVTRPHNLFDQTFGAGWRELILPELSERMLQRRWSPVIPGPSEPHLAEPRWERDLVYWTMPGSGRQLLADLWQPPEGVKPSGLAFIYIHGGYYEMLDKDSGTRPFFRHLTSQGHVVMDIAYRLLGETDIFGMVDDAKYAVVWMKQNAESYGIDTDKIVLAGGSSGGNLALLAAYSVGHPEMTPADLQRVDTSVRAVVSYYGVHDWDKFVRYPDGRDFAVKVVGGEPETSPRRYELASPITYVRPGLPATLLFQGGHDQPHLIEAARELHRALVESGVPAVYVELPQTEHAFDLILWIIAPPGQTALYDLDRFLGLMASPRK